MKKLLAVFTFINFLFFFTIVNAQVIMHLKSNTEIIARALKVNIENQDSLRYYLVLKNDTAENRRKNSTSRSRHR